MVRESHHQQVQSWARMLRLADPSAMQILVQGPEQPLPKGVPGPRHQLQAGSGVSMPAAPHTAEPGLRLTSPWEEL